jgi:hypothetical protein
MVELMRLFERLNKCLQWASPRHMSIFRGIVGVDFRLYRHAHAVELWLVWIQIAGIRPKNTTPIENTGQQAVEVT